MNPEKINFRQSRDFGETFNVSVKFLRQNFKLFSQSLLFIGGPFVLISAIAGAIYYYNGLTIPVLRGNQWSRLMGRMGWPYIIFIVTASLSNIALTGTVFSYMINYMEKGPGNFSVKDVGKVFAQNLRNILAVFFSLTTLMILIVVVIVVICIGITTAIPLFGVLLIMSLIVGALILFPPLIWQLSTVYLIKMQEGKGVFESFSRAREVMRNNFWWTWVIVFCSGLVLMLIGFIFSVPQAIYQMVFTFTHLKGEPRDPSVLFLVLSFISTFFTTIIYSLMHVINAFHYYSLTEQKDGIGLMERINEIGQKPENSVNQEY